MEVVAEADGVAQALRRVVAEEPDIVTMDLNLPDGSGVDACRAIKTISPETQVLILTAFAHADLLDRCRAAGAAGYVLTGNRRTPPSRRRTGRGAEPTDVGHGPRPVKHLAHASVRYQPPQSRGIWSRSSPTSTASWSELRYGFTS